MNACIVTSIFLYTCIILTITAELETRVNILDMKNLHTLLGITCRNRVTNEAVRDQISRPGEYTLLLIIVKQQ